MKERQNQLIISEPYGSWKSLAVFVGLAFAWTWAFMIPAASMAPENLYLPLIIISAFGPFLAAMVTVRIFEGKENDSNQNSNPI